MKTNIFSKVGFFVKDFFAHWNTPPKEGYYLSNKEFLAYSVGGMGVQGMGILTLVLCNQHGRAPRIRLQFRPKSRIVDYMDNGDSFAVSRSVSRMDNGQHEYKVG